MLPGTAHSSHCMQTHKQDAFGVLGRSYADAKLRPEMERATVTDQ
jgi:hypothetical protein